MMSTARKRIGRARREITSVVRTTWDSTLARARRGDRTIIMTPRVGLRLGNLLYVWLQAHARTAEGSPTLAMNVPAMDPWLHAFPALRTLTMDPADLRFHDRRTWDPVYLYQRYGVDFHREELAAFVRDVLAPELPSDYADAVVINVRRGDYYTDHRAKYEFDQVGYIAAALDHVSPASEIRVVSDDPEWCRTHLDPLLRGRAKAVAYDDADPLANFLAVATASRLIGANSTFSYWGGYVAAVVRPGAVIVMPRFHGRMAPGRTDAHQLDPRWIALDGFS